LEWDGVLDHYLKKLSRLRTDSSRHRWSAETCHRAPHKPFLLLSVIDLISQGTISKNFIEPSFGLAETFASYWSRTMPLGSKGLIAYPFYHLESDRFWRLLPRPDAEIVPGKVISSLGRLRELYLGASLDPELWELVLNPETRGRIQAVLIGTYFATEIRVALVEQGRVNYEAKKYSEKLLVAAEELGDYAQKIVTDEHDCRVRDQGFRKAVVSLYQHRCALCGLRMRTPDGHTVVDAAHIHSWSESSNDHPTNGMALCRLCHWSFDEGLMSVGTKYEVLISRQVMTENNFPGHILTLSDRGIFKPEAEKFWPSQQSLGWHRKKVLRR
jgi:putative restriction endonuclease